MPCDYINKKYHYEKIVCPECGYTQNAQVLHAYPFFSYVKKCRSCGYIIMESEWEISEKKKQVKE